MHMILSIKESPFYEIPSICRGFSFRIIVKQPIDTLNAVV